MIKQLATTIGLLCSFLPLYAQDCEAVKAENKRLKAEINSLRYSSVGKAPDGSKVAPRASSPSSNFAAQTQTDNEINFKIISVVGNRKSQTVTVTLVVTNQAANVDMYTSHATSFTNDEGDEFRLVSSTFNGDGQSKHLYTNTPLKGIYVYGAVLPKVSSIKSLPFQYDLHRSEYFRGKLEFRDMPITWH